MCILCVRVLQMTRVKIRSPLLGGRFKSWDQSCSLKGAALASTGYVVLENFGISFPPPSDLASALDSLTHLCCFVFSLSSCKNIIITPVIWMVYFNEYHETIFQFDHLLFFIAA